MEKRIIFENEMVETCVIQWKRNRDFPTYYRICQECERLITSIIRRQRYDTIIPFQDLKNHLYVQLHKWIDKWTPGEGRLYSYISACIKHGCISIINKETVNRSRHVYTDVPLESLGGSTSGHEHFSYEMKRNMKQALENITCRWPEQNVKACLRYMIHAVLENHGVSRRRQIIETATIGFNIPLKVAKFLLDWTHGIIRHTLLKTYDHKISINEVQRCMDKWSFMPDVIKLLGEHKAIQLIETFSGLNVRFPSKAQIRRYKTVSEAVEFLDEDQTPAALEAFAKDHKISLNRLEEDLEVVSHNLAGVIADTPLYESGFFYPELAEEDC